MHAPSLTGRAAAWQASDAMDAADTSTSLSAAIARAQKGDEEEEQEEEQEEQEDDDDEQEAEAEAEASCMWLHDSVAAAKTKLARMKAPIALRDGCDCDPCVLLVLVRSTRLRGLLSLV